MDGRGGVEPNPGDEHEGGDFSYVATRRGGRANRKNRKGQKANMVEDDAKSKTAKRIEIIAAKKTFLTHGNVGAKMYAWLDDSFGAEKGSSQAADSPPSLQQPSSLLLLGLGSVKDSRPAQVQLAFLLLVRDRLETLQGQLLKTKAYDPVFDQEDVELLSEFRIEQIQHNRQGRHLLREPTFVFMPHCTKTLYENLLRVNWTWEGLNKLWLCCNDLSRYTTTKEIEIFTPCIDRIVSRLRVHHLPILPSPHNDALNDLALQRFQSAPDLASELAEVLQKSAKISDSIEPSKSFWLLPEQFSTDYTDPELI